MDYQRLEKIKEKLKNLLKIPSYYLLNNYQMYYHFSQKRLKEMINVKCLEIHCHYLMIQQLQKKKKNAFRRSAETYDVEVRNTKDLDNALYLARK